MRLGINDKNEIIAVNVIPEGLTVIEVSDNTFGESDPTDFIIHVGEDWQEIIPRFPVNGL